MGKARRLEMRVECCHRCPLFREEPMGSVVMYYCRMLEQELGKGFNPVLEASPECPLPVA